MNNVSKQDLLDFNEDVKQLFLDGQLPYMIHLGGGNEDQLIDIFQDIRKDDYIFSTHRSHYHYLLAGGDKQKLLNKIKEGNSMFVFDRKMNFFTSSIVAGTPCIAAGVALALQKKQSQQWVWCFVGDGAEDQGHFAEAVRFVYSNALPCTFIIEDNDRNVTANKKERHNNYIINWPEDCVVRYRYTPTYPHGGTGTTERITFDKDVIEKYKGKYK